MLDIIIPILNEEKILTENSKYYKALKTRARVIFVDGGSTDRTVAVASEYGNVVLSSPGRGIQKNRGVEESTADYLLFLHVDSFISENALDSISRALKAEAAGGCLTMHIQDKGFIFRIYEKAVNVRSRAFGVIDGDLGMFVRKNVFKRLGGFDLLPVMEDLVFSQKLRKAGRIKVLNDPIYVSSRKWHERGFVSTFLAYTFAHVQLWTGRLKSKYRHYGPQYSEDTV